MTCRCDARCSLCVERDKAAIEAARREGFNAGIDAAARIAETSRFYDGETARKIRALRVTP